MAKDDYHVIVYQILAYLYRSLKEGAEVEAEMLRHDGKLFQINRKYWAYIMENMKEQGFISGITVTKLWGKETAIDGLEDAMITPAGIEYLCDNRTIKRAYEYAKDVLAILPIKL